MAAINLNKVNNPLMKPIIDSFLKKGRGHCSGRGHRDLRPINEMSFSH